MKKIILIMLFIPLLVWLGGCKEKSTEVNYNPNVLSSKDYIRGEDAILEIVNAFFKGINDTLVANHGYGFIDACDVVYYPSNNSMKFSYGDVNRICQDGKLRRGLFRANFSGEVFNEGVTANILTDSLFVDNLSVEAAIDIQNLGINSDNLPEFLLKVTSSQIMLADTNNISGVNIMTDYIMIWAEGSATPAIHEDDIFHIKGTATGISSDGYEFSIEVLEPLENYVDCFWISKGISQIRVPVGEFPTGNIDYLAEDGCFNEMHFFFNDNFFYDMIK